ncbi:MAG: cohesin domain-containing protein [Euryarchaeota archaeon]|nr:cohesin domain-containing protein [Euryarchaeota archaeon]
MAEKGRCNNRNKTLKLSMVMASVVLLSLMFTFLAVIPAAGQEVVVSVNAPEEVDAGESFDVTIDIEGVTDFNSGQFDLSFDSSVVEVTDVSKGSIDGETIPELQWDFVDAEDTVRVFAMMPEGVGVSGSGHLAEVGFKVTGEEGDKSVLDISDGSLFDNREIVYIDVDKEFVEDFKDELNDEEISDDLKEFFKANGRTLENPTVKVIQKDELWRIIDKRVYSVKFEKGKVEVLDKLKIKDTGKILKTKWVDAEILVGKEEDEDEDEDEEVGEEVTQGYSNITTWNPFESVVNNAVDDPRTFNISVNQVADVSWQINGTEMQTNESVSEAVYMNTNAVIGTWNVSAIATNTTTGLSDMHTWIWHVTLTATVTSTPTLAPGGTLKPTPASGETPKPTPTPASGETPKPVTTPTPTPPGFEAIFAIAMMLAIAYILRRKS